MIWKYGIKLEQFGEPVEETWPDKKPSWRLLTYTCRVCGWKVQLGNEVAYIQDLNVGMMNERTVDSAFFHAEWCKPSIQGARYMLTADG